MHQFIYQVIFLTRAAAGYIIDNSSGLYGPGHTKITYQVVLLARAVAGYIVENSSGLYGPKRTNLSTR